MPDKEDRLRDVSEEELESTLQSPAVYTNRFTISVGEVVRIAFFEQRAPGGKEYHRSAVAVSHQNAISLYKLLQKLLKPVEDQIAQKKKEGPKNG